MFELERDRLEIERLKLVVDIWKKTVDVQPGAKRLFYHFIGISVVFGALVSPIWLFRRDLLTPVTLLLFAVAAAAVIAIGRLSLMRDWKIRARHRIDFFYGSVAIMLLMLAWAANIAIKPQS